MEITVYNKTYKLGGFSVLHAAGHYTAVTFLYSKAYYYDGIAPTKEQRMKPLKSADIIGKDGSTAYYFITNNY